MLISTYYNNETYILKYNKRARDDRYLYLNRHDDSIKNSDHFL